MVLTLSQARRLALHSQGLGKTDAFGRGINAVERAITSLRYVQIDTISVVDRAHHHVLKSRVSNYKPGHLDQLLSQRKSVFEYWHHAAAYLPMQDYRYYRPLMAGYAKHHEIDRKMAKQVLTRIREEGPLMSRDFENTAGRKSSGWWDWKPAKVAMEQLFLSGELMVSSRQGFQKQFDLTERVLPADIDTSMPSDEARGRFYVEQILRAQGVARLQDLGYMRVIVTRWEKRKLLQLIQPTLEAMVQDGTVLTIPLGDNNYFALAEDVEQLPARLGPKRLKILSPFDNLVINREKLSQLFGFDYQIECYVPEPKRQFGYFTLPILLGDQFIGRMDAKAHRKTQVLEIKNIWLEPGVMVTDPLVTHFDAGLRDYATSLGCESIQLRQADNPTLQQALSAALVQIPFSQA